MLHTVPGKAKAKNNVSYLAGPAGNLYRTEMKLLLHIFSSFVCALIAYIVDELSLQHRSRAHREILSPRHDLSFSDTTVYRTVCTVQ